MMKTSLFVVINSIGIVVFIAPLLTISAFTTFPGATSRRSLCANNHYVSSSSSSINRVQHDVKVGMLFGGSRTTNNNKPPAKSKEEDLELTLAIIMAHVQTLDGGVLDDVTDDDDDSSSSLIFNDKTSVIIIPPSTTFLEEDVSVVGVNDDDTTTQSPTPPPPLIVESMKALGTKITNKATKMKDKVQKRKDRYARTIFNREANDVVAVKVEEDKEEE